MDIIDKLYSKIECQLTSILKIKDFVLFEKRVDENVFGSRYSVWVNKQRKEAIRLVWDGKDSWFVLEESPYLNDNRPNSWADIVIVPFNEKNASEEMDLILSQLINELKIE
ncbi:MAG: hypothetical protein LKG19_11730 [Saprospiraceae bacterium]|jgi:hypothetical protein|nr:hypothetical protein [Saprospiraceae bacterium]